MKIYISGAITNAPYYESYFRKAEKHLAADPTVDEIINPVKFHIPDDWDYDQILQYDLRQLCQANAIYMLSNWRQSKGARAELATALLLGLHIYLQEAGD